MPRICASIRRLSLECASSRKACVRSSHDCVRRSAALELAAGLPSALTELEQPKASGEATATNKASAVFDCMGNLVGRRTSPPRATCFKQARGQPTNVGILRGVELLAATSAPTQLCHLAQPTC